MTGDLEREVRNKALVLEAFDVLFNRRGGQREKPRDRCHELNQRQRRRSIQDW
jgi:hypothetical protein